MSRKEMYKWMLLPGRIAKKWEQAGKDGHSGDCSDEHKRSNATPFSVDTSNLISILVAFFYRLGKHVTSVEIRCSLHFFPPLLSVQVRMIGTINYIVTCVWK